MLRKAATILALCAAALTTTGGAAVAADSSQQPKPAPLWGPGYCREYQPIYFFLGDGIYMHTQPSAESTVIGVGYRIHSIHAYQVWDGDAWAWVENYSTGVAGWVHLDWVGWNCPAPNPQR